MKKVKKDELRKTIPPFAVVLSPEIEALLWTLSGIHAQLWNKALEMTLNAIEMMSEWYKQEGKKGDKPRIPTEFDFNMMFVSWRKEISEFAFLNTINARQTLKLIPDSCRSYFALKKKGDTTARKPRFHSSDFFSSMSWLQGSFTLKKGKLILGHNLPGKPVIAIPLNNFALEQLNGYVIKKVTLYRKIGEQHREKQGKVFVAITYAYAKPDEVPLSKIIGIDVGAGNYGAIDGTGKQFLLNVRRPDKYWMPQIGEVQKKRDACAKGSNRWKKFDAVKHRMEIRMRNQSKDWERKMATDIAMKYDLIVIGESDVRIGLAQSKKGTPAQHCGVQNTGKMARFVMFLKQKAAEFGKTVIEVKDANLAHMPSCWLSVTNDDEKTKWLKLRQQKIFAAGVHLIAGLQIIGGHEQEIETIKQSLEIGPHYVTKLI